jgi:expansin (peptidoglycan-binding protein)
VTRSARWLAGGGGAVLAAVIGVAIALQTGGAACAAGPAAAPPVGGTVHRGKATFYTLASGGGNCSYVGPPADGLYVALSPGEYAAAAACGGYLDVTGPKGKVRAKIVDQCPECPEGHIDLSRGAFARIADPVQGVVPVTYRAAVNPPLPGPLSFRIKEGASPWWFAVLVVDHGNPLRSVEARPAGRGWRKLARTDYNYWLADSGLGPGPYAVRVTDVYGTRATATGIRLAPEQTQETKVAMYGRSAARAPVAGPSKPPAPPSAGAPPPSATAVPANPATGDPASASAAAAPAGCADPD